MRRTTIVTPALAGRGERVRWLGAVRLELAGADERADAGYDSIATYFVYGEVIAPVRLGSRSSRTV